MFSHMNINIWTPWITKVRQLSVNHPVYIYIMAFYKDRPWQRAWDFLYLRIGSILWTKYFIYGYIIVNEVMCEDLENIIQIIGEIWAHLLLWITYKIARLLITDYCYFCIVEDATHSYCLAKFRYNWNTQWGNMDKIVDWRPKNGIQFKVGFTQKVNSIT